MAENEIEKKLNLESLSPQYRPEWHQEYVSLINQALEAKYKNIALSGVYGSGKSSILNKVFEKYPDGAIRISLAPLASGLREDKGNDTNSETIDAQDVHKKHDADETTNLVQKEIVKQILYSVNPSTTPHSRFHRINPISNCTKFLFSIIGALLVVLAVIVFEWNSYIRDWIFSFPISVKIGLGFLLVGICTVFFWTLSYLVSGRVKLKSFSAGGTAVALSDEDKSDTYFDKYLDEIVYFFISTKKHIVIFEDLDRFNNPRIFDSLRELNNILNNGPRDKTQVVQFIYAIKDSVFSNQLVDDDQDEVPFARTKFFDIIIPVVPFISHENAARIAFDDFKGTDIDADVFNVAAQFIPDKRILTNIKNEYLVYHKFLNRDHQLELAGFKDSRLLGFIIYKNTYLVDANRLPAGKSRLDFIYNASRTIISQNIDKLNKKIADNAVLLNHCATQGEEDYAESLGEELQTYIKNIFEYNSLRSMEITVGEEERSYGIDESVQPELWKEILNSSNETEIYFKFYGSNRKGDPSRNCRYTKNQLSDILSQSIDIDFRTQEETQKIKTDSAKGRNDIELLRGYDFEDLIIQGDAYCAQFNKQGKFDRSMPNRSLKDFVQELYDGPDSLAMALLSHGWVNRNYVQYSTIFDSKLTLSARDFIYHNVDSNEPDYGFKLSRDDAAAVVNEISQRGGFMFQEPRMMNVYLLDYLAEARDSKTNALFDLQIGALAKLETPSRKFLNEYLKADGMCFQDKVVQSLTVKCPRILEFLVSEEIIDEKRLGYVNMSLKHLSENIDYASNVEKNRNLIRDFISKHIATLAYGDQSLSVKQAKPLVQLASEVGLYVDSLQEISKTLRDDFIRLGLYKYTRENVCKVSKSQTMLPPIDAIKANSELYDADETGAGHIYKYTLDNLDNYLKFLRQNEYSIQTTDDETLLSLLKDIHGRNISSTLFDQLFQRAGESVIAQNVAEDDESGRPYLSNEQWKPFISFLLRNDRVLPAFRNVEACVYACAQDDSKVETQESNVNDYEALLKDFLLHQDKITDIGDASDNDKRDVAAWIVNMAEPYTRISTLINDVLDTVATPKLKPNQIDLEKMNEPEYYAELMSSGVIPDDSDSWNYIADEDWSLKKPYIDGSSNFVTYMSEVLDANEMCTLLTLEKGKGRVSENIWDNLDRHLLDADSDRLYTTCHDALYKFGMHPLSYVNLKSIQEQKELEDTKFIQLLVPSLTVLKLSQVLELLRLFNGNYAMLVNSSERTQVIELPDSPASHMLYEYFHNQIPNGTPMLELAKREKQDILCVKRLHPKEWKAGLN